MSTQIQTAARLPASLSESLLNSEQPLRELVSDALKSTGYRVLEEVFVTAHEGFVRLRGEVDRFYEKQIATAAVLAVKGVVELENDIRVRSSLHR